MVLLVLRGLQLLTIVRKLAFRYRIVEMRVVKTANNLPTMFVLERIESDPEYEKLQVLLTASYCESLERHYDCYLPAVAGRPVGDE